MWFVGWVHKGKKNFEVIPQRKFDSLIHKLIFEKGVHPGAIFISKMVMCHWLENKYHKGCSTVWINKFYEELENINNPDCIYKEIKLESKPVEPIIKYGYVSPEGKYFYCPYQGHSSLARDIVGKLIETDDPQRYLTDNGWLVIYHNPYGNGTYAVQMKYGKKMTDKQYRTLENLKIPSTCEGYKECLMGEGIE